MALRPGGRRGYKPQETGYQWTTCKFPEDERLDMARMLGLATPLQITHSLEQSGPRLARIMYRRRGVLVSEPLNWSEDRIVWSEVRIV